MQPLCGLCPAESSSRAQILAAKEHSAATPQPDPGGTSSASPHQMDGARVTRPSEGILARRTKIETYCSTRNSKKSSSVFAALGQNHSFPGGFFTTKEHKELKENQFYLCALCVLCGQSPLVAASAALCSFAAGLEIASRLFGKRADRGECIPGRSRTA